MMQLLESYGPQLGLVGVLAVILLQIYFNARRDRTDQGGADNMLRFNESLLKRIAKLELDVVQLREESTLLRLENQELKTRLAIMESAHQDAPIPMWLKDTAGVMLALNSAYEREFLRPLGKKQSDYVGKTDLEVWGPDIAREYGANDGEVQATRKMWLGTETVPQKDGTVAKYAIMKYPRMEGSYLIGIAGIAIPKDLIEKAGLHIIEDGLS